MRFPRWFIVVCYLFLLVPPAGAVAPKPLDNGEFAAIVQEAWQAQDPGSPRAWHVLDRDKLARMLEMPEFAALDDRTKEPLIDQAGAWELMPFDSPASALALWAKWFPQRVVDQGMATDGSALPMTQPTSYYADGRYATGAGALIALLTCYPNAAWYVRHDEPMLWVMEHGASWDQPNAFDFGMCVRKQSEQGAPAWIEAPDTERGRRSAEVIERVLSQTLLKLGCTGEGPNRCLPMLHALHSLNPKHDRLPSILKAIEPNFAPLGEITIPAALADRRGPGATRTAGPLTDEELAQVREIARRAMRQAFFLSAKIPVLLDRPGEWPAGEVERTVDALTRLTLGLNRVQRLSEGRSALRLGREAERRFADPWGAMMRDGALPAAAEAALRKQGRDLAAAAGCEAPQWQLKDLPSAFWLAFAEAKLVREHTSCGALAFTDVGKRYGAAVQGQTEALGAIGGLRRYLDADDAAARELVDALAVECPPERGAVVHDPWQVCRRAAALQVAAEAERAAEEALEAPPACADELPAQVAGALGYLVAPQFQACKPMPDDPQTSILAMLLPSLSGELPAESAVEEGTGEGEFDLEVLLVRTADGEVLSRLLIENAYASDAWRLSGITIDTARYRLARGVRAFGVRVSHSASSRVSPAGASVLSLFVRDGFELRRVLQDLAVETSRGEWDMNCEGEFEERQRTIAVSPAGGKGLADLIVTTTTTVTRNRMVRGECVERASRGKPSRAVMHHDGKTYPIPKALEAP